MRIFPFKYTCDTRSPTVDRQPPSATVTKATPGIVNRHTKNVQVPVLPSTATREGGLQPSHTIPVPVSARRRRPSPSTFPLRGNRSRRRGGHMLWHHRRLRVDRLLWRGGVGELSLSWSHGVYAIAVAIAIICDSFRQTVRGDQAYNKKSGLDTIASMIRKNVTHPTLCRRHHNKMDRRQYRQ